MVESSTAEINHVELEDSHPQATKSIAQGATNSEGSHSPLKRNHSNERWRRCREGRQIAVITNSSAEHDSTKIHVTDTESRISESKLAL